ncbi:hypothetical protein PVAND_001802 [Polypedilum vanderplanki]|uniref:HTH psq-type domain-containing protein n=1 Tax=Polypedilum vanderplanki TaxID=319348 RepID=A0A9J6BP14_POLVA|nr:hypothetical protein PVAND_001802 [Polypedilum vanderplanki]
MSIRFSERKYGVPRNTIYRHMKGNLSNKSGIQTILSSEVEGKLAKWLIDCAKKGDPRTKEDLKIAATDYDKYENDPPKFGPKGPSIKCLNGFLKRHPSVSVRTPENLGKASATVTQDDINRFFSKFYSYMVENGFEDVLSRPDALFNLDETSFDLNQVPRKVLAKKGRRRKFNYGVVNSREILTKLKEDEEAKQKIQQEKDERKALREEKKLLKNISLKIKKKKKILMVWFLTNQYQKRAVVVQRKTFYTNNNHIHS